MDVYMFWEYVEAVKIEAHEKDYRELVRTCESIIEFCNEKIKDQEERFENNKENRSK